MPLHDAPEFLPTVDEIAYAFRDEIASLGGTIADVYETPGYFNARAVLPNEGDVRPGDGMRAGVALRVFRDEILVSPYTFRRVCSNGAIAAQAIGTRRLERVRAEVGTLPSYEASVVTAAVRDAVRASAAPESFASVMRDMRSAADAAADLSLHLLPALAAFAAHEAAHVAAQIIARFEAQPDRSLFGLINATTSLARDTRDAERRWRLEELGGTMGARLVVPPTVAPAGEAVTAPAWA